jgi:protein-tyrosine phosphatase
MDLFWIDPMLAVATRPRGGDWLAVDLAAAARDGVDVLVSCLEPAEERELDLAGEAETAEQTGITFVPLPIPDMGRPGDRGSFDAAIGQLLVHRGAGRRIAVHCRQGRGRSPLVAAAVLVRSGHGAAEAWSRISERRGVKVPETPEQGLWLEEFARGASQGF